MSCVCDTIVCGSVKEMIYLNVFVWSLMKYIGLNEYGKTVIEL